MWPFEKTFVEKVEKEFNTKDLKNKHIYYDINIRTGDPEAFRSVSAELISDLGFTTSVNKITEFEDSELEGSFQGGRLKPVRAIIKATKIITKGSKFPMTWKILAVIGIVLALIKYLLFPDSGEILYYFSSIILAVSLIFFLIREKIFMAIWFKFAGIYNIENQEADIRVILASDCSEKDHEVFKKLESEISEIYNVISRKYVRRKEETKTIVKIKESAEADVVKKIREVNHEIELLQKRFLEQGMTEPTYLKMKSEIEAKKAKLETLLDIVSM